ncbi:Universal stress protein A homolog 2 [Candidatus Methylobacter favarea]|uniref:Universal stress protein n=1 Tax=Candidatus Methylobacter favarea TaxID=2707345 RepID=A0A8S0XIH7_9GAMM|nr:universal stress protein [Candidatus Methylobacter favarea]CAA9892493.1 Universal stress protein A homolog 2 [Candidatus Methylobacter favarea]
MENYKHILLAADFFSHGEAVAARAKDLADKYQAKLSILHVLESLPLTDPAYGSVVPYDMDLTAEMMKAAKKRLAKLGEDLKVPEQSQLIELGSPKLEIVRIAQENKVDLIVVGSHGRHGLALLLGSTANGVLHRATCDVVAVRLPES